MLATQSLLHTESFVRSMRQKEFNVSYESETYMLCRLLSTRHSFAVAGVAGFYAVYQAYIRKRIAQFYQLNLGGFGVLVPYYSDNGVGCMLQPSDNFVSEIQARAYDDPSVFDRFHNLTNDVRDRDYVAPVEVITLSDTLLALKNETGLLASEIKRYVDKVNEVWLEFLTKKSYLHLSIGKFTMYKKAYCIDEVGELTRETIKLIVNGVYEPSFLYTNLDRSDKVPWRDWSKAQDDTPTQENPDDSIAGL